MVKAASPKKEKKPSRLRSLGATAASYFGGGAAGGAAGLGGALASTLPLRVPGATDLDLSDQQISNLHKHMGTEGMKVDHSVKPLESHFHPGVDFTGSGLFTPEVEKELENMKIDPHVAAPRSGGALLAHELGHANSYRNSRLGKGVALLKRPGTFFTSSAHMGAALAPGDSASADKMAPILALAGHAPTLIDEAAASGKALRGLHAVGASKRQLATAAGQLGLAYGSYAAGAGGDALGAHLTRRIKKKMEGVPTSR